MKKELVKKDILGGSTKLPEDKRITKALKKIAKVKVPKQEQIKVQTNDRRNVEITLRRDEGSEKGLANVFNDPNATNDQRNAAISNYLWAQGKENGSFLMELYRSKGEHTRETRAFKAQMRQDYEIFADFFIKFLNDFGDVLNNNGSSEAGSFCWKGSEMLTERIAEITAERMKANGFGVYLDRMGNVYDTRNKEVIDRVKDDVKATMAEKNKTL